tara:strand:+ start:1323 stop:1877 length:555 start_codon:yes stop_codon:yes gene_type:complete
MDNTGVYESSFAVIMLACFMSPILVYFFNCLIGYTSPIRRLVVKQMDREFTTVSYQGHKPETTAFNFTLDKPKQAEWRGSSVELNKPIKNKKTPSKSHVFVNNNQGKVTRVNFNTPKPQENTPKPQENTQKNKDLVKESVKSLKTLGYKSGEVKKTLEDLCISNKFNNSESLIEAFFRSGDKVG